MAKRVFDKLLIQVPSIQLIRDRGVDYILENTHKFDGPFLYLMGARWFEIASNSKRPFASMIEHVVPIDNALIVMSDFAAAYPHIWRTDKNTLRERGSELLIFSDVTADVTDDLRGTLNGFDAPRYDRRSSIDFYEYGYLKSANNKNLITVPLGCGNRWVRSPLGRKPEKHILLDEAHKIVIKNFSNKDLMYVRSFMHSLDVCKILAGQGYRISSFSRESSDFIRMVQADYPFIELIQEENWIPFNKMASYFHEMPIFYSHFQETHGYPIYENLQAGNAVIGYAENVSSEVIRTMQNGVLLSQMLSPELSANMVDEYFNRYVKQNLQVEVAQDAARRFSCETFTQRLIGALALRDWTFSS